jgi:hypothetical protein
MKIEKSGGSQMKIRGQNIRRNKRGITLVALVITIIVLLILAGITINLTIGEGGIITTATEAGANYVQASTDEQSDIADFVQETEALINVNTDTGSWDNIGKVNAPDLLTGMTPIKFNSPVVASTDGKTDLKDLVVTTTSNDTDWYNYSKGEWANAKTKDESMWVWIPRFAYIVDSSTQTFKIVFLIGTTDYYYNADGKIEKAQRATADNLYPDTTGSVYTVHPAFTNESSINYANGGWDDELTGIWVAKFEAAYPDDSENSGDTVATVSINGTNWYYPIFKGQKYSYNDITISNAFLLSQEIAKNKEVYGLNSTSTDSHLMKNSEWGAVAYLSKSQYGLNTTNIVINNVTYNATKKTIRNNNAYAVTGYAGAKTNSDNVFVADANAGTNTLTADSVLGDTVTGDKTSYAWYTSIGISASSTGTIYGIYDLSGGLWERTASFVNNTYVSSNTYGTAVYAQRNTKYTMVYDSGETGDETGDSSAGSKNYAVNKKIGDAVKETVKSSYTGTDNLSGLWYDDFSYFPSRSYPFLSRGGMWYDGGSAGLFAFYRTNGGSASTSGGGFRPVLVKQ